MDPVWPFIHVLGLLFFGPGVWGLRYKKGDVMNWMKMSHVDFEGLLVDLEVFLYLFVPAHANEYGY